MQMLLQSPILEKLGFAILHNLWQVGLLWLLLQVIEKVFRLSSSGKYYSGLTMQLLSLLCFITTFYNYSASGNLTDTRPALFITNQLKAVNSSLPYLAFIYLSLLAVFFIKWLAGYIYTIRLQTQGITHADESLQAFINKHIQALGLTKKITVYISDKIKSPVTIGSFKPFILLPIATVNGLSIEQMEAVLLHELAHIKRYDFLWNILLTLIETILFFNPFVKIINTYIDKHREYICDDWVLQTGYKPMPYAEALLSLARAQADYTFALAATGNKNQLLTRIQRMLGVNAQEKRRYSLLPVAGISFIMLLATICSSMQKPNVIQHKVEQQHAYVQQVTFTEKTEEHLPVCKQDIKVLTIKQPEIKTVVECRKAPMTISVSTPPPPPPPVLAPLGSVIELDIPATPAPKMNAIHSSSSFNAPVMITLSVPECTPTSKADKKAAGSSKQNKVEEFSFKFDLNNEDVNIEDNSDNVKFATNLFKAASNIQVYLTDKELKAYTVAIQDKVNKALAQLTQEIRKSEFNNIQSNDQLMALLKENKPAQEIFLKLMNLKKMQYQIEKKDLPQLNSMILINNDAAIVTQ